jgi:hypothetical protein
MLRRPVGFWDVEAPTFSRQSAHRLWRGCQPYAPADRLTGWVRLEKSNELIGNQTRDLPASSIVPQPTALLHVPRSTAAEKIFAKIYVRTFRLNVPTSSVGIAARLRAASPRIRDLSPVRCKRSFSSCKRPDRIWGPTSLLYKGHWSLFPPGGAVRAWSCVFTSL